MGNQLGQTIQSRQFIDQNLKDFEYQTVFVEEIDDKCFGQVRIHKRRNTFQGNGNIFIMEKANHLDQKVEYAQLYAESQARLELQHKNLLQFLGYDFVNQKDFCTSSLRSRLFFEYYYHDLGLEVQRRSDCQEYFNEDELWYILDSLVQVCSFLQENQLFHGDLRPQSVKLTQEGFVKIGDHGLINPLKNGFYKTLIRAENGYLSPEQLSYLMLGLTEAKYNVFKQEVFSLGLTILQSATLRDVSQVYDWDKMLVKVDILKQLIEFAASFYSQEFIAVINLMLQFEDTYRPDFVQLRQYVKNENTNRPGQLVTHAPLQQSTITPQLLSQPTNLVNTNPLVIQSPPINSQLVQTSALYPGAMQSGINVAGSLVQQYPPQIQQTVMPQVNPHLQSTVVVPALQHSLMPQSQIIMHPPTQNVVQSQVIVQRPLIQSNGQGVPMQTVIQSQPILAGQQPINQLPRVMSNNTLVTNQVQQPQQVLYKQDTFGNYQDGGQENYKKSVKFNENTDILTETYKVRSSHHSEYSNLKRSQIQFNTDLDRRVQEALEMTRQTIKKNQQVPNIFSEDSPIKKYDHKV
ncbi:hypothetical protein ABPG74_015905 [Tetrahymena malaccensis]